MSDGKVPRWRNRPRLCRAFGIKYNSVSHGETALYNGNIAETEWRTANTDSGLKWYSYGYDELNRIANATANSANYHLSDVSYDKNGNIKTLNRKGHTNSGATTFGTMDDLVYTYDSGNKLTKVLDNGSDGYGFVDGANSSNEYGYDVNGNMTRDDNKGITSISYNHLNLPTDIATGSGSISYVYDAMGTKLEKSAGGSMTLYAGNYIYENGTLQFFSTPEGYVKSDGMGGYDYVYQYKDIWDNVRLEYSDLNNDGAINPNNEILKERNYYPFGLEHRGYNNVVIGTENNHKTFQGQELTKDLNYNVLEYKFRHYDPAIGRFFAIDPIASEFPYNSVYAFQENKLGLGVELEGKELKKFFKKGIEYVARNSKGQYKRVSRKHAEKILENKGSVTHTQTRGGNNKAKNLMESTTNKKVVRHDGHEMANGKTGKDHFQKKAGDGSHVFVETAKNGAVLATAGSADATEEFAGDMVEFGTGMTDTVENIGTKIFGDNEFGQFINDINPLNIGFSDLFKSMNETLNGNTSNSNTSANNSSTNSNTSTATSTTNNNASMTTNTKTTSSTNCDEDGCN